MKEEDLSIGRSLVYLSPQYLLTAITTVITVTAVTTVTIVICNTSETCARGG